MPDAPYDILLGDGLLGHLPDLLARHCRAAHYAVISDSTVAPLYAEAAASALSGIARTTVVTFPAGEWNKTRETWAGMTDRLLAAGVGRDGAIVALGGGVVGDLAGFVAATYLRGIPYVQVPTTLLAMIDSSIGGKTGVDTPAGKNLVGAFCQPKLVIADVATLATLPPNHLAAGMAEAIKHGAIADRDYFERIRTLAPRVLSGDRAALHDVVERSVGIKAAVVADDERERGRRAILNFGHTVAHALEAVTGYALLHGEAVAMGMAAEARLGQDLGVTAPEAVSALLQTLETYRLPTRGPAGADAGRLMEVMQRDKKVREASVRFAFLKTIGEMHREASGEWTRTAPENAIRTVLAG
ncbi:MAG TPA: 3-dehydroquinate synthase [Gemmatimonadales bacterium]|nr:3-dehydroquinate synthase [Gemmatimonadales bacterium]